MMAISLAAPCRLMFQALLATDLAGINTVVELAGIEGFDERRVLTLSACLGCAVLQRVKDAAHACLIGVSNRDARNSTLHQ